MTDSDATPAPHNRSAVALISDWPVRHAAAGWTTRSQQGSTADGDRVFPLASVTKPIFAYALLIAHEEGSLTLDAPLGPPGSTVRHLLAHASGLPPDVDGPMTPPAQRRIYTNVGFDVLAEGLYAATSMTANEYVQAAICEPLGLRSTRIDGSPAHAGHSTVDDLLVLLREWLNPTLIDPTTMADAIRPQFPDLAGVLPGYGRQDPNPWGLGFELRGHKQPHWTAESASPATFGHFGRAGTMIWVDPDAAIGAVALADRQFGPWCIEQWPIFNQAVLDQHPGS